MNAMGRRAEVPCGAPRNRPQNRDIASACSRDHPAGPGAAVDPGLISAFILCFKRCRHEFIDALTFLSSTQNKAVPVAIVNAFVDGDICQWTSPITGAAKE